MKRMIVQCEDGLTKVAFMENKRLIEYYVDQPMRNQWIGSIYKGRVVNVLPGMQAAFVDIGQAKNAYLYIDDLLPANLEQHPEQKPSIEELVSVGDEILVQVTKEPLGTKGARLTTHFTIPGRWLVYMPYSDYIGISRKIVSETERNRLKMIGEELREPGEGLILRTVANGESKEALAKDIALLREMWFNILKRYYEVKAPALLYHDLDMVLRLVRDIFTDEVDELIIDSQEQADEIIKFLQQMSPELVERVHVYNKPIPIYQYYDIEQELEKSFRQKVWLENGGYLIFDQTEALTVIDVNTGKFTGSVNLEQTVFETNMEAAERIAQLIRLRDIGGIIIVDFIDMNKEEHRHQITEKLENIMKQDRTKSLVVGWTKLGLLEITRKKVRENLENLITETCPHCQGSGRVFSHKVSLY